VKPNVGAMRMGGEPYEPHSIVYAREGAWRQPSRSSVSSPTLRWRRI
jgi:hypothetical protein